VFLEQLYDLHRAIAIQKLLMQNCPEVQQVSQPATHSLLAAQNTAWRSSIFYSITLYRSKARNVEACGTAAWGPL
jgi:hypothetical protein